LDPALIRRAQDGDVEAFTALVAAGFDSTANFSR